jgi:antitoxin component of RelBE/YafQ-DinJ toxin-antitoxin module
MGYLEQFARNRRGKEKTEVLTARLPESLYGDFKDHCEELGLSISEAVFLLVEREMKGISKEKTSEAKTPQPVLNTNDDKKNDDVVIKNTQMNTKAVNEVSATKEANANRFTTKQWEVDGKLPCPKCGQWFSSSNFSRHAKSHGTTTQEIFTNERYLDKAAEMIKEETATIR